MAKCLECKKALIKKPKETWVYFRSKRKFCNPICFNKWLVGKSHGHKTSDGGGWKHSEEVRKKMSKVQTGVSRPNMRRGAKSNLWKGGVSSENMLIRKSGIYAQWRKAVFERDDYTCQHCGQRGGRLNADHIKSFAEYPDLRFELTNGQTLCVPCHIKTPTFAGHSREKQYAVS